MSSEFSEFRRRFANIFTGSVAYNEHREFIESNFEAMLQEFEKEMIDAIESAPPYRLSRIEQVFERWCKDE